jgi:hypothetical protein
VVYGVVFVALLVRFVRAWRGLAQLQRASSVVVAPVWQTNAAHWLGRVARRDPHLLVLWQVGIRPATGS